MGIAHPEITILLFTSFFFCGNTKGQVLQNVHAALFQFPYNKSEWGCEDDILGGPCLSCSIKQADVRTYMTLCILRLLFH